jgi:hypothetical protein
MTSSAVRCRGETCPPAPRDNRPGSGCGTAPQKIAALDPLIPAKAPPEQREEQVLDLCAWGHGELVYVHPFADGDGRMARSVVLWFAVRYGLPVFLDLRPRPSGPSGYEMAAKASITGRHQLMRITLTKMLAVYRTRHAIDSD